MTRLFEFLYFFPDRTLRDGAGQMALDEALLRLGGQPVLRCYHWAGEAVTFGCSQSWQAVRQRHPHPPLTRRWTGGGIVEHGRDWTFSLAVPRHEPLAAKRPAETYELIHAAIVQALAACEIPARLAGPEDCAAGPACFDSPALHDILGPNRAKLCGGAQRRSRDGLLHQGSVQCPGLPAAFGEALAGALACGFRLFSPAPGTLGLAERLAAEKYARPDWNRRIP
jgi:lipoate-protein ligase A